MDNKKYALIGLGASGVATARFFKKNKNEIFLFDSNKEPSNLKDILSLNLKDKLYLGLDKSETIKKLQEFAPDEIILSPGCVPNFFDDLKSLSFKITCDVELFVKYVKENFKSKVIGITGTNGKSTTTALTHYLLQKSNYDTFLGGNFGIPVFDLIDEKITEKTIFVLELSSFQLEMSNNLELDASVILNLAPDHLDRYSNLEDYYHAKYTIYDNAKKIIVNKDQEITKLSENQITFSKGDMTADFYIKDNFIYYKSHKLIATNLMPLFGVHNLYNFIASLALIFSILNATNIDLKIQKLISIAENIKTFKGLEHRSEIFLENNYLIWVNDSKGTNLGATVAALQGLSNFKYHKLWLMLGGILKEKDFSGINAILNNIIDKNKLAGIFIFGQAKEKIYKNILSEKTKDFLIFETLEDNKVLDKMIDYIIKNNIFENEKNIVLFSPACSSFDMFKNYQHRGKLFKGIVQKKYDGIA